MPSGPGLEVDYHEPTKGTQAIPIPSVAKVSTALVLVATSSTSLRSYPRTPTVRRDRRRRGPGGRTTLTRPGILGDGHPGSWPNPRAFATSQPN